MKIDSGDLWCKTHDISLSEKMAGAARDTSCLIVISTPTPILSFAIFAESKKILRVSSNFAIGYISVKPRFSQYK